MSRFNLVEEKWIPVRFLDGDRDELGIQDTLLRAKEIAAIENSSPLVVASVHRFLLAVLYRALEGPTDIDQAKDLYRAGLPGNKIEDYLKTWHDRFWLFDEKYPFGQVLSVPDSKFEPWTKLTAEYNATTNKVLFDHTDTTNLDPIAPGFAARCVISTLNFSISGGRGYKPSPSADGVICIPIGNNLHDTLLLSLVPYPNRLLMESDTSIWERESNAFAEHKNEQERIASGFADIYTWPSRFMRLIPLNNDKTSKVPFIPGVGYEDSDLRDPMVPYEAKKDIGIKQIRWEDRGLWRYFDSLLPDESHLAPRVIEHAVRLAGSCPDRFPRSVMALAQSNNKAKIEFWRMERFAFPGALAGNKYIRSDIRRLLENAEKAQKALWLACQSYAGNLLCRGGRKTDGKDIKGFISQMPAIPWYWSTLESKFHEILQAYTLENTPDEIELQWLQEVRAALRGAWDQHRASLSMGDAWTIRALIKAEGHISRKIKELDQTIAEYKKILNKENL